MIELFGENEKKSFFRINVSMKANGLIYGWVYAIHAKKIWKKKQFTFSYNSERERDG